MTPQPPRFWIQTAAGRAFDFENITPESVDLVEIAWSLSNLCRYNGHTRRFYSVAEHCVLLSRWYSDHHDLAKAALLHDAHEAYTGDLTRPLQRYLWQSHEGADQSALRLQSIRDRVDAIVAEKAQITIALFASVGAGADCRITTNERCALHNDPPFAWGDPEPKPLDFIEIKGWKPKKAFRKFMQRMEQLGIEHAGTAW